MGDAADRDLALGHDLEQRRLHLRRRAVDLVGQHEVREDRAEFDVEGVLSGLVDAGADDVGRHQVGRELQTGERPADRAREGLDRERLGDAGDALEQDVALGEQGDQHPLDQAVLTDDDALDLEQDPLQPGGVHRRRGRRGLDEVAAVDTDLPGRTGPRHLRSCRRRGRRACVPFRQCPTPGGQAARIPHGVPTPS